MMRYRLNPPTIVSRFAPPSEEAEAVLADALALLLAVLPHPHIASAPPTPPYVLTKSGGSASMEGYRLAESEVTASLKEGAS